MSRTLVPAELQRRVRSRAGSRCEYCLIPESVTFAPHEIDHVVAEKHGGATTEENLALSCTLCNRRKGSDLASIDPQTEHREMLFDPEINVGQTIFGWRAPKIEALTAVGRATVHLLELDTSRDLLKNLRTTPGLGRLRRVVTLLSPRQGSGIANVATVIGEMAASVALAPASLAAGLRTFLSNVLLRAVAATVSVSRRVAGFGAGGLPGELSPGAGDWFTTDANTHLPFESTHTRHLHHFGPLWDRDVMNGVIGQL